MLHDTPGSDFKTMVFLKLLKNKKSASLSSSPASWGPAYPPQEAQMVNGVSGHLPPYSTAFPSLLLLSPSLLVAFKFPDQEKQAGEIATFVFFFS